MNEKQAASLLIGPAGASASSYFKLWMPYCYQKLEHPGRRKHVYLPLNRRYKPLGYGGSEHYVYEDFAHSHGMAFPENPEGFEDVWWAKSDGKFWLYADSPASRLDYFERLERLMLKRPITLGAR